MAVRQPIMLAGYCSSERAFFEYYAYLQSTAQRVLETIDRKLERKGVRIQWQAVPNECNVWIYFTEVTPGDEVLRLFIPLSGYARVAAETTLVAGDVPPFQVAHAGRSGPGFLRNSNEYVLRRSADRLAVRIAKSICQWVAQHRSILEMPRAPRV
jgi:hypothetical protein